MPLRSIEFSALVNYDTDHLKVPLEEKKWEKWNDDGERKITEEEGRYRKK